MNISHTSPIPSLDSKMIELTLNGVCIEYDFRALILTGAGAEEVATRSKWMIAAQGEIDLHLGVALFDRPFVFTPTRVITERQQIIEGGAVFEWLTEGCYRMPRSEVFGLDIRGKDAQVFARDIDIEESPLAVFGHGTWIVAAVEIDPTLGAEVHPLDRPELPDRFGKALRQYRAKPSIDWVKQLNRWTNRR
jgi:hypothetical protein